MRRSLKNAECSEHSRKVFQAKIDKKGSVTFRLKEPYFRTSEIFRDQLDWANIHLFWSDERSVPPTSPESNYRMAMSAGFKNLPIPPGQIHRMEAVQGECAVECGKLIQSRPYYVAYSQIQTLALLEEGKGSNWLRCRRGWDSNPRYASAYTSFRSKLHRPLGHPSIRRLTVLKKRGRKSRKKSYCFLNSKRVIMRYYFQTIHIKGVEHGQEGRKRDCQA